ncbi:PPOX class F420-dependent oxidoreductase [Rhodococcus sp. HNM0563]|uniref:pyridoxamine 5'-phosphate oxidase family protein n=1 Tax=unclassified Rhodococcus (in: high G+C Gram-positive bacteria) TaxID=192944 RepID=UPI00146BAA27|nr:MULTISPECIES: PPOX class F420-dependent oxidoreductase [unclassified Rhodococcus (in: high G+C Gram-positive bacteria)]MCK0090937.1 PPOX class F420-dependent oxidoreductase [Rhodococcus sp. F64268]NLU61021.1 PPOX class F420-dependent oxidoreductase [Rhodococcus sp. HNM0563]
MGTNRRAEITMTEPEISDFLHQSRVATLASLGPHGAPHLVAMWYAVRNGEIWFETKAKSQKVVNLRRDHRITALVEAGDTYDQLRGVSIEGRAEIVDDRDILFDVCKDVWERYTGPYTDAMRQAVEQMMHKRVAVRVVPQRVRSWDHRKLGMPAVPLGGTTAAYLPRAGR